MANYATTVIADTPVAYWRLGEPSGTVATDEIVGEVVAPLTSANTSAQFLTKCADMTIDAIELAAGNYTWQNVILGASAALDRTSRPLTVRPAVGATVNFVGPASSTGIIFQIGSSSTNKVQYVTFDGRDKNGGGAMIFKDFAIASSGVFEPRSSDHCTFQYLTFTNLARDHAFAPNPYNSWCFYMSGSGGGSNDHLLIDRCTFNAPAVSRDIACMQIASSGSHGTITITNVLALTNYNYAFYDERPTTSITLDTWTMTNSGNAATPASIRFVGAVSIAGSYSNITATSCNPLSDTHSGGGTVTNGGGNSGI